MDEKSWDKWRNYVLVFVALYLILSILGSGYVFLKTYAVSVTGSGSASNETANITFFPGFTVTTSLEIRLVSLVFTAGALGAAAFGLYGIFVHVARKDFDRSWIPWYVFRPFLGAVFALAFYVFFRAGLFSTGPPSNLSIHGFIAMALLVGMFEEEALAKFKQIADAVLTKATLVAVQFYSGQKAPQDGSYLFVKHVDGVECKERHPALIKELSQGSPIPVPDDCKQPGIWMRISTK